MYVDISYICIHIHVYIGRAGAPADRHQRHAPGDPPAAGGADVSNVGDAPRHAGGCGCVCGRGTIRVFAACCVCQCRTGCQCTHTHTHTHTRTHAHPHAHTRTHKHTSTQAHTHTGSNDLPTGAATTPGGDYVSHGSHRQLSRGDIYTHTHTRQPSAAVTR